MILFIEQYEIPTITWHNKNTFYCSESWLSYQISKYIHSCWAILLGKQTKCSYGQTTPTDPANQGFKSLLPTKQWSRIVKWSELWLIQDPSHVSHNSYFRLTISSSLLTASSIELLPGGASDDAIAIHSCNLILK